MSDEYRVINPPVNRVSGRKFREELQTAADDGFEWVGAVASGDGGDFVVMKRQKSV
jgi:hypothetical protein